ncbi:MAG: DUF1801 domain-containing protein [Gammaproteobacteria bacterium]
MSADLDPSIAAAYGRYPATARKRLMQLRKLIFQTASEVGGVGAIEECLRWGQPTYLTTASDSGSMLRLHWAESLGQHVGLYVHCQTALVEEFRERYPAFKYHGNRALLIPIGGRLARDEIADCMALALMYRLRSKKTA